MPAGYTPPPGGNDWGAFATAVPADLSLGFVQSLNSSTGKISLVAGANISLSQSNSAITILGAGGSVGAFSLNNSTNSVSIVAGDNITLSQNASTITIVGASAAGFSTVSMSATGNTTLQSSGTFDNALIVSASGIISAGIAGNVIALYATTPSMTNFTLNATSDSVSLIAGGAIGLTNNLSTISISAPVATNFSLNGTSSSVSIVGGANISTASSGSTLSIGLILTGASGVANFTLNNFTQSASLVAGGAIGITNNASTISISAPVATNFSTVSLTALGNTTLNSVGTFDNVLNVSGAGAVSVGASLNSITISAPTVAAGGTQSFSGGGTSITGSAISVALVGGNNISLASASGAGSLTLTVNASSNALNNVSLLNASSGALSVSAGAGIGIGQANSTITISASVQTSSVSLTALGNTTGSSSGTFSNLLNISGAGIVSVGAGAGSITISASTPSVTNYSTISGNIAGNTAGSSTFTIGNTLQISLTGGLSGTASGSSITLSAGAGGAAGTQSLSAGANSVTGTGVSLALAAGAGISLATATGVGSLTVTISNSSPNLFSTISLSASGNTTGASSSGTMNNVLAVSGMAGASVGAGNGTISISAPAASTLVGGSGISLTSGGNSITIVDTGPGIKLIQNFDLHRAADTIVTKAGTVTGTAGVGSSLFLSRITALNVMSLTEIDVAMSIGFPATSQGAGTLSRSMVLYSFGNGTSLASVMSASGTSSWNTGTSTAGASTSLTQFQGGWSSPLIQPMTFASTSISPGEYVVGQLFNFAQASSTWTLAFYGDPAARTFLASAATNLASTTAGAVSVATVAGSGVNGVSSYGSAFLAGSMLSVISSMSISAAVVMSSNATGTLSAQISLSSTATQKTATVGVGYVSTNSNIVSSIGTVAGSIINGLTTLGAVTNVALGALNSSTLAQLTIPNFGYIGTGSTTSGFPTAFMAGIMSTGAVPTAITLTSSAVTFSGSAAFQQPWFCLVAV